MGLLDYFTTEGKIKRHASRVANRDSQPEDRDASIRWLSDEGSPKAIVGLLGRFEMTFSQGLKDAAEKEWVFQLLLAKGDDLEEPLRHHLRSCKQFHPPLRLLEQLRGADAATAAAFELLDGERNRSTFYPEKKKNLLVWLAERKHPEAVQRGTDFLGDFDEEVRYAALELIANQGTDSGAAPLLAALTRPGEDSNRLKHRICEVFAQRGWSVAGADLSGKLPIAFAVQDDHIVAR
jgi:hypothetical protein